ncbi:putative aflatoxin efflux pump [Microthyrium microscopicum]|uniref:Putative aflatoxin efflux pump n=1 Tax=Microthyrium microscopicum TaxID=703497 RepID=A0A6A6TVX0_9PEZI|nr:putative aflatoxin efflux pump [Microthyrium microscopicum]
MHAALPLYEVRGYTIHPDRLLALCLLHYTYLTMSSKASLHSANNDEKPHSPIDGSGAPAVPYNEYEDAELNYQPKTPKFWLIIIGMYLSIFLVALDRTIIATAIPAITNDFNTISDISWYGSAYMLTCACFNPISGRVYQLYSTKWTFILSVVVFEAGSALSGAAPSSTAFIIGRAIAGIGGAGIFSGGNMIILPLVPLRKRPIFTSIFGLAFGISSVLGPILGGTFTDQITWRWCFYINLPIGGFTVLVIFLFLNVEEPKREKVSILAQIKRLDPLGMFFFVPSMISLILALQWGGTIHPWSAPTIIGLLVSFAVLFIAFIAVEILIPETAMAPPRVVVNRSIAGSMLFMFLLSGAMMSVIYYLAIWFQAAKGDTAMKAGVSTIPVVLSLVVMGIISAAVTQKVGYYVPAMLLCPVVTSIGAGLLSTLKATSNHSHWIGYQTLFGLGIGFGFQNSNLAAQNVLPRKDVPLGMALMFFMQQIGGSIFLSVAQNIFSTKLVNKLSGVAGLDLQVIVNTGATDLRKVVPPNDLGAVVDAYSYALTRVFVLAAALSAAMILGSAIVEWKSLKNGSETAQPKVEEAQKQVTAKSLSSIKEKDSNIS